MFFSIGLILAMMGWLITKIFTPSPLHAIALIQKYGYVKSNGAAVGRISILIGACMMLWSICAIAWRAMP